MKKTATLILCLAALPAAAHPGHEHQAGIVASLSHLITSIDPLLGVAALMLAGCALAVLLKPRQRGEKS
jgi:hydrogenase/urease accessory protein HupE